MPTVRSIATDALAEIGVLGEDEGLSASQGAFVLRYFQRQIDAWAADRLTCAVQTRTTFTLTSGTTSVTLGASGATVTMQRPVWINAINYIVPGSSPDVEVPMALLDQDMYAALSMKTLSSSLPQAAFYQTSLTTALGTLQIWPKVDQSVTIVLYTPQAVGEPTTLDSVMTGPPGYRDAFHYQLAIRLMSPFGVNPAEYPMLVDLAAKAYATMKRPNVQPGLLGVDPALVGHGGGGYNVQSDS